MGRRSSSGRRPSRREQARRHRVRRWTAALLAGLAAFAAVSALRPEGSAAAGEPTLVAARDVAAGAVLTRADLALVARPAEQRPRTALTAYEGAIGRVVAVPISAREVVTPERLAGAGVLAGQPEGHVAVNLSVTGVDGLGLSPGDHVDVYAMGTGERVAADAVVLATRAGDSGGFAATAAGSVTVALSPGAVTAVATSMSALESGSTFILALRRS